MHKKMKDKKFLWILLGCFLLIIAIFINYIMDTEKMYDENLDMFYDAILESKKERIKEVVERTINEIDVERASYIESMTERYAQLDLLLTDAMQQNEYDDILHHLKMGDYYKRKDFEPNIILWNHDLQQVAFSSDDQLNEGANISEEELRSFVSMYQIHTVKYVGDQSDIFILGITKERFEEELKRVIADKIRETKLADGGYIWVNEILDYNGGDGYARSIVQPNMPEIEGQLLSTNDIDVAGNYPYLEELKGINKEGEAYYTYYFKKNYSNVVQSKISYSQLFSEFNWVIGTGLYLDDLEEVMTSKGKDFDDALKKQMVVTISTTIILFFIAGVTGLVLMNYHERRKRVLIDEKNKLLKQHYSLMEDKYDKTKKILHDVKNHLIYIFGLAEQDHNRQIIQYIKGMQQDIDKLDYVVISRNKVIDIILNEKLAVMKKEGIHFDYEIETIDLEFIDHKDIVTILSNIFDNAIESSMLSTDKRVLFKLYSYNEHFVVMKVINSCDDKPKVKGNKLITHKLSKEYHGYGMENIENCTKKYNGNMIWSYDESNREFHIVVMFPKP